MVTSCSLATAKMPLSNLLAFLVLYSAYTLAVEPPPRITQPPTIIPEMQVADTIYFIDDGKGREDLPCRAIGSKPLTFEWTKNGKILNISDPIYMSKQSGTSRIIRVSEGTGTIMISELEKQDEGIYQCIAKNSYGVSLSKKVHLVKATIGLFDEKDKDVRRYRVIPANSLKLSCNPPESDPPGKTKWVKYIKEETDTRSVELDNRVGVDDHGNLYFANIQQTDDNFQEKYACLTNIMDLNVYIEGAFSYIEVLPGDPQAQFPAELLYFTTPDSVVGLKGKSVSFKCIFGGNPTPEIEWVRINGDLVKSRMIQYHQELLIRGIEFSDAGMYECRGKNAISAVQSHRFKLEVESPPEWTAETQPVRAGVEENAAFECAATGKPTPKVDWFINGKPFAELPRDPRRTMSMGQLRFRNLTRDDAQVIQCNASNIHGYLWKDVSLSILAYKPEIKVKLTKVKVAEGHSVILPCETDGKPNPIIYWKKGDVKLEGGRYFIHRTGNLTIDNVQTGDGGQYTCFTENRYGKASATGELQVRIKTTIRSGPYPHTQKLRHGSRLQFTCQATTDYNEASRLTISWLKNGKAVNMKDPRISKTDGKGLLITDVKSEDTGNYTCVASNGLDSDSKTAEVKVVAPPDPPSDVNFKSCLARSALVTWTPGRDNFSPIIKYHVEFNHSYAPTKWQRNASINNPEVTEASVVLSPHANYTFRVIAENELGKSRPSEFSKAVCQSNPDKPDKHPPNVRTDRSKPGVLIVKWDQMKEIDHNADNFKYVLVIKKDGKTTRQEISDWTETQKEIDYGLVYTPFEIYVEAHNALGTYSRPAVIHIGYTGEDKPNVTVQNFEVLNTTGKLIEAKSAWFQWDAVETDPDQMKGEFHGYKIRFWKVEDPENTRKEVEIPRQPTVNNRIKRAVKDSAVVTGLYPFSHMQADIVARNTYYQSNGSDLIDIITPEGVPGKVEYARVLLRGSHHFLLEWGRPLEENGNLTGYRIGYREVNGLSIGKIENVQDFDDPERSRAYLGGLTESREYRVYVWAMTKAGQGEEYYIDAKTANPGPLQTPIVQIALTGEDFVNVTWNVNGNNDAPAGSIHYIKYRKSGESDWEETEEERIHNWMNVSGLVKATKYELIVVASNGVLEQHSLKEEVITKGGVVMESSETSIAQAFWFIGMMVAIAVLILFLIVVCFFKRSRGEKYHVQERERLRGTDPEAATKDHFNEFNKNGETEPLAAGSPDSFDADTEKVVGGSETDSMAEYGDVDPSKFNEDGSFIGQYGDAKPTSEPNAPSAMSTFV